MCCIFCLVVALYCVVEGEPASRLIQDGTSGVETFQPSAHAGWDFLFIGAACVPTAGLRSAMIFLTHFAWKMQTTSLRHDPDQMALTFKNTALPP